MVYFCRLCKCFHFTRGIIWGVNKFMLLVYMCVADKESIGCCLVVLSIKYLFLHVLALWYLISLNPTVDEFHYCLLDYFCCKLSYDQNSKLFNILIFKNGF